MGQEQRKKISRQAIKYCLEIRMKKNGSEMWKCFLQMNNRNITCSNNDIHVRVYKKNLDTLILS